MYQNGQLIRVSTKNIGLSYTYDLNGALRNKTSPLSSSTIKYNDSALPETIVTNFADSSYPETLDWYPSGKLNSYSSPNQQKQFTYTSRGHLQSSGSETYEFDFNKEGSGVRTAAPRWHIPSNGIDDFGRVVQEVDQSHPFKLAYDPLGQEIVHDQKRLDWDPWGRLIKVTDNTSTWEACYDALGRRLQTRYTKDRATTLITSFYDPEEEFQEIGFKQSGQTFWKIYGPDSCDALVDDTGASVYLLQNALGQLSGVLSHQGLFPCEQLLSAYGPQTPPSTVEPNLFKLAQSLSWHSKSKILRVSSGWVRDITIQEVEDF